VEANRITVHGSSASGGKRTFGDRDAMARMRKYWSFVDGLMSGDRCFEAAAVLARAL
jgi:hypothetical protein